MTAGEYPATLKEAASEIHVSGDLFDQEGDSSWINQGNPTGMYRLVLGNGQNAVMANGLGGTSLINANVFLRADKKTLASNAWPKEIRNDPVCLDHCKRCYS
jgi:hypothetical protein